MRGHKINQDLSVAGIGTHGGPLCDDLQALGLFQRGFSRLVSGGRLLDPEDEEDVSTSISWEINFRLRRSFSPIANLEKSWFWPLIVDVFLGQGI